MKSSILLLALSTAIAFGSCTTAYKTGQTPDDVYFSPGRAEDEYVRTERRDNRRYEGSDEYYDDRYLRMKVRNRYRWSDLDDWYYYGGRYNTYTYFPHVGFYNNPWTPSSYWNCTYNPYYSGVVIVTPKSPTYSKPRTFNLNTYNNNALTNKTYSNPKSISSGYTAPRTTYSNSNNTSNAGNFLRNIFSGSNNNNSSSGGSKVSSSSSSSGSSSGSSGSRGGSAPVRRF